MKPLWPHTLAWIAAALAAVLLAMATPDGMGLLFGVDTPAPAVPAQR